eukprot:s4157_g4.t2
MSIPSRGYDWVLDACQNRRHRAEQQLAKPVLFEAVMHLSVCSTTGTMRTNCHGTRWRKPPWEFLALACLITAAAAEVRPRIRWAQSNTTLSVELSPPRGLNHLPGCNSEETPIVEAEVQYDRISVTASCRGTAEAEKLQWEMELREDILPEATRAERTGPSVGSPSGSGLLLLLRKRIQHRWDRPFKDETNLPDEDEVELPRALNLRRLNSRSLEEAAKASVLVVAMRYPWCTACEEKDKAFVKVSKVAGAKEEFADVVFGVLDLREEKDLARSVWEDGLHLCLKSKCPLHVFKPEEPLNEPYTFQVQLLYEMDEAAMMGDPMAGMPGHTPKGQTTKPNFERFERDLALLMPKAVSELPPGAAAEFRRRWDTAVIGSEVNATAFRHAARELRGTAAFAMESPKPLGSSSIQLWRSDGQAETPAIPYDASLSPLNATYLAHFARVHAQPMLQNYTWDLKDQLGAIGMPVGVLWVNYSDTNNTNATNAALTAFRSLCSKRRGTNASQHILCCVMDQSYSYYQREYGSHEPYPFPFFGVTRKLGFGAGDRYGFPFKEPVNRTVLGFFGSPKRAAREMSSWVGRVLAGRVPPSHESGLVTNSSTWVRGQALEVVWKTYQREINGSTSDVLLELYDDQRKRQHIATAVMDVLAKTLKDYADIKIARMEVSQNYVPAIFGRKQFSKETEYFWIPPSIATGEWTPGVPVKYPGEAEEASPAKLLKWFKKQTMSRWSLKEALEVSSDISEEVMGYAKLQQQADDRAEEDKQQMIKKMMTTLKKESGMVDVGEMMGLKKAADALGSEAAAPKAGKGKAKAPTPTDELSAADDEKRAARKAQLQQEEKRQKDIAKKDKEKRKRRLELEKQRQEGRRLRFFENTFRDSMRFQFTKEKRRKREAERLRQPATPLFAWGQSKEQIRISVAIPKMQVDSVNVSLNTDQVDVRANDWQRRPFILSFELREFIAPANSSWALRYSEEASPQADGVLLTLQKETPHRWDRLAQNHTAVKNFLKKDWVQDDGDLEEEHEEVELPSGQNVRKVAAASLDRLLERHSLVVLASRFPWCDKCKEKDREFTKAARLSRDKDHLDMVAFGVMDAREEKYFARKHNVSCSDTCDLLLFKQDEKTEPYLVPGRRFAEEVQIDCYKHLLPVVSEVANKTQFDRVTTAFDTAIMGFFHLEKSQDPWYPRFRAVARQLRGHALFGAAFNGRLPQDMGIEWDSDSRPLQEPGEELQQAAKPLVLLFKPKEQRHVEFTGELTLEKLAHFSKVLSLPLISQYSPEGRQKYQELKVPLGMMWLDGESEDGAANTAATEVLKRLALRFSGHLVFVTLNNTRDGFLMRPFGLDPRRVPAFGIAAAEAPDAARYALDETFQSWDELTGFWLDTSRAFDRIERFCASFLEGTLEASHESAELPPTYRWPGPGSVHEVVWKTFRESVYRTEKDVLLELYSPYRPQHRTHLMTLSACPLCLSPPAFRACEPSSRLDSFFDLELLLVVVLGVGRPVLPALLHPRLSTVGKVERSVG